MLITVAKKFYSIGPSSANYSCKKSFTVQVPEIPIAVVKIFYSTGPVVPIIVVKMFLIQVTGKLI